ncbi:MAG: Tim44 domain-containing protein [Magnetococcales bacterium]|nr:Tim44 domain-containing protein [Magnetococcales bacterium]
MKIRHPLILILLMLIGLAVAMPPIDAEAARFGGGSSSGSRGSRSFSTPREATTRPEFSHTTPSPAMAAPASRPSGFGSGLMGGIAGLALGGLIGSMLFGGAGGGIGLLEILLIGGVIWFVMRRLGSRGAPRMPQPMPMPVPNAPIPNQGRVSLEKNPQGSEGFQFQSGQAPGGFSFGQPTDEVTQGLSQIASMDPGFNEAQFLGGAKSAFQMIQGAWSDWSVERLRPLLTERMWSLIEHQARDRQNAGRRDILEKIRFQTAEISEAWQEAGEDWLTVHFVVEMVEYETDVAGKVLSGDPNRPIQVEEYWTFCRPVGNRNPNWFLSAIQQPGEVARSVP